MWCLLCRSYYLNSSSYISSSFCWISTCPFMYEVSTNPSSRCVVMSDYRIVKSIYILLVVQVSKCLNFIKDFEV